jgi:hypothetical protein
VLSGVEATDSLRRQIDSPGAPSANAPRVAGSGVWLLKAAVGSASSGPLVAPAMIALPAMVSVGVAGQGGLKVKGEDALSTQPRPPVMGLSVNLELQSEILAGLENRLEIHRER